MAPNNKPLLDPNNTIAPKADFKASISASPADGRGEQVVLLRPHTHGGVKHPKDAEIFVTAIEKAFLKAAGVIA